MVQVPAGPFLMGTSDEQILAMLDGSDWAKSWRDKGFFDREQPQHAVTYPPTRIGRYPVTNAQYAAFVRATRHDAALSLERQAHPRGAGRPPGGPRHLARRPGLCDLAPQATGRPYRLPTEAEWEKAARGTDGRLYPWGNDWDPVAATAGRWPGPHHAGRPVLARRRQPLRLRRHGRQRLGMVWRLVQR